MSHSVNTNSVYTDDHTKNHEYHDNCTESQQTLTSSSSSTVHTQRPTHTYTTYTYPYTKPNRVPKRPLEVQSDSLNIGSIISRMDSLYNTQFYSWIKNPQNREYAALRVRPLIQEYNSLSHTAHVLRWIAKDWKPNEAKDLFRLVTDKWDDGKRRLLMFYLVRAEREEEGYLKKRRRTGKSGEKEGDGREHSRYQWNASQVCDGVEISGHRTLSGAFSVPNTPTANISMTHNNNNDRRHGVSSSSASSSSSSSSSSGSGSTRNDIEFANVRLRPVVRSATWDSTSSTVLPSIATYSHSSRGYSNLQLPHPQSPSHSLPSNYVSPPSSATLPPLNFSVSSATTHNTTLQPLQPPLQSTHHSYNLPYLPHVHPCQSHDAVFLRPIINSEPTRMVYPYSHGDRTRVVRNGIVYQAYPGYVNNYAQIQHERIGEESMKAMGEERRRRRRRNSDVMSE